MIATRRGLAILAALAVVLAIVLALDLRGTRAVIDRALVPGLDTDHVVALRWDRPGRPAVQLVREAGAWRWSQPFTAEADAAAVANVLATLRAARWHRRAAAAAAGVTTTALTLGGAGGRVLRTLRLGEPVAGTEQQWIVDGDAALLVDRWVARALDVDELALLITRPFEAAAQAAAIDIVGPVVAPGVRLEGAPRRLVRPQALLVDPAIAGEIERALAALTITELAPAAPAAGAALITIEVGTVRGTITDGCGEATTLALLVASTGAGCVPRIAVERLLAAIARLHREPVEALIETRPAPLDPTSITLPDGGVLDLAKDPQIDGAPADPARVAELLAVLGTPVPRAELRPAGPATPSATLVVTDAAGVTIRLELVAPSQVRRAGEPLALQLTAGAWAVLTRPASALRETSLWIEDPLAITTLAIDGVRYQRGAVIGEWTRTPAAAFEPPAVEALVAQLAAPPLVATGAAFTAAHTVTLTVTPPSGPPEHHVLELGAPTRQGCPVRANGVTGTLPGEVCAAVARLAR